jgi:hypothetical protein
MKCEYHLEGLESVWRAFLSGHFKSLSRYFPVKDNECHIISAVNLLGVFEQLVTCYFCILFWITKTTPQFLLYMEGYENQGYKKWVNEEHRFNSHLKIKPNFHSFNFLINKNLIYPTTTKIQIS